MRTLRLVIEAPDYCVDELSTAEDVEVAMDLRTEDVGLTFVSEEDGLVLRAMVGRIVGYGIHDGTESGLDVIAAERERQIADEGWTPDHDDRHENGELACAAACYAIPNDDRVEPAEFPTESLIDGSKIPALWPWEHRWYKRVPYDRVRELAKAGALIAAEIDRLQRLARTEDR